MKRTFIVPAMFLIASALFAQSWFSGELLSRAESLLFSAYTDGRFDSLLNPQNIQGFSDLTFSHDLLTKIEGSAEDSSVSVWLGLSRFPAAQALMTAAAGDPIQTAGVADLVLLSGDTVNTLDLLRAEITFFVGDYLSLTFGRQSFLTGYGYGWNPTDFANPLKDPLDPRADLKGVDGLSISFSPVYFISIRAAAIVVPELLSSGIDFKDVRGLGEITLSAPSVELKLGGFYDHDEVDGEDAYVPSLGTGVLFDVLGVGIYGELAYRRGGRSFVVAENGDFERRGGDTWSWLAGIEYVFPSETSITAEFFYNGEGWDKIQRENYFITLDTMNQLFGAAGAVYYSMYRPGYFARQYILLNLLQPFYGPGLDFGLTGLFSPDSGALMAAPTVTWYASGSLSLALSYSGFYSLYDDGFDEISLLPLEHSLALSATFSF